MPSGYIYFAKSLNAVFFNPADHKKKRYIDMATIKRPVQLPEFGEALRELSDDQLKETKTELERAILKLRRTNNKLLKLCGKEPVHDVEEGSDSEIEDDDEFKKQHEQDSHFYHEVIAENDVVLRNQLERVDLIQQELVYRGLAK